MLEDKRNYLTFLQAVMECCRTSIASDRPTALLWATRCALPKVELFSARTVSLVYQCRCSSSRRKEGQGP